MKREIKAVDLLAMYRFMVLMREFEGTILRLYQQGKVVGGAYSGNGNEATVVASAYALKPEDYLFPMHRDLGAHFVKGQSVRTMMLQYLGRGNSPTRGRDSAGHYSDAELRIYGNISHLGAMVPVATGVALATKLRKESSVAMTYIGDGGSNIGEVHEALAMTSVMRLPLILIIENNQYAYSTPVAQQFSVERLSDRAAGYGIPGITVDGTSLVEVYGASRTAVERARAGGGPTIIESVTMRMHGHAAHDNAWYVPGELLDSWRKNDPILRCELLLREEKLLSDDAKSGMMKEIEREIEDAVRYAEQSPFPRGEDAAKDVYAQ